MQSVGNRSLPSNNSVPRLVRLKPGIHGVGVELLKVMHRVLG